MATPTLRRLTGSMLIAVPVVFTVCFLLLQQQFEYPAILRQPTGDVLQKFQAGGTGLIAVWYALTLSAVLFIPLVVLLHALLAEEHAAPALQIATAFGLVAGLVQALGFLRWPFLVPQLAQSYLDPAASEAQRAASAAVFDAFNRYAGMAVGEHLGYLSTSIWTFFVAARMLRAPLFGRWLGLSGMALALGVAAGLLEPAGVPLAGVINSMSYLAWALWLIIVGARLLVSQADARVPLPPMQLSR